MNLENQSLRRNVLSVALCTFNGASFLPAQLNSIQIQTRLPDEMIVCDDGSADNTAEIIESFSASVSFPVRLQKTNRTLGITKNFERAIGDCRGDIIVLCDQDDVWQPQKLERVEDAFMDNPAAGLVLSNAEIVDENLVPLGYSLWSYLKFKPGRNHGPSTLKKFVKRNPSFGTTMAFRGSFKKLLLPIPSDVAHDMWCGLVIAASAPAVFISDALVRYRQHEKQYTGDVAKRLAFSSRVADARNLGNTALRETLNLYQQALTRLQASESGNSAVIRLFEEKINHMMTRAALPEGRLERFAIALRELVTRRYHRYSDGSLSFAKDAFL